MINKENVQTLFNLNKLVKTYKKKVLTKAVRMKGAFTVKTSEGTMRCKDGYLAMDARGYPYSIAKDEFELIYELVIRPNIKLKLEELNEYKLEVKYTILKIKEKYHMKPLDFATICDEILEELKLGD